MATEKIQSLADDFNKTYWDAGTTSDPDKYFKACLLARQLVRALGEEKILHDKLLDYRYDVKTLELKDQK